jgi:hypothetical protein
MKKRRFNDLSLEEQAEIILKKLKLTPEQKQCSKQELIDEVIEHIILPVLRERHEIN